MSADEADAGVPGRRPSAAKVPRRTLVFSLASATLGSSNGLIPSAAPATAVANSQRKNSAPSPSMLVLNRSTGCPAASSAASLASSGASRSVVMATNARSLPYSSGRPSGSSTTGRAPLPCLPVLSATSCSIQRPSDASEGGSASVSLSRPSSTAAADERAEGEPGVGVVLLPAARRPSPRQPRGARRDRRR